MKAGVCRQCVGDDSKTAESRFRACLADIGATLMEPAWLGAHTAHRALCSVGHECTYTPAGLLGRGHGCQVCALSRRNVAKQACAEAEFRSTLADLGATLLEPRWLGSLVPHRVRCVEGHESTPRPASLQQGRGVCRTCAGTDPQAAEAAFRARLAELGATLLEPEWLGSAAAHRVRCVAGHECRPTPSNARVWGVCLRCRGWDSNAFYVLTNEDAAVLKLGITTGDGRQRLGRHASAGFTAVHRFLNDLPEGVAEALERHALSTLRLAGERPVQGREYFPASVLALVLDVVDNYPTSKPSDTWKASA